MDPMYEIIEQTKSHTALYIGERNLSKFRTFLDGYYLALDKYKLYKKDTHFPLDMGFFHEYVKCYYNYYESTMGWCNMILRKNDMDEEKSLAAFFDLFDRFKATKIYNCFVAEISLAQVEYHHTNANVPTTHRLGEKPKPIYQNPRRIYLIELSQSMGFMCLAETEEFMEIDHLIHRQRSKHEEFLKKCFGPGFHWEQREIDNIALPPNIF